MMVFCIFCIFVIQALLITGAEIAWIVGKIGESQSAACIRNNFSPTKRIISISWNATSIRNIINTINEINSYTLTVNDCCVPSLWCSKTKKECFTHSYGAFFENYGARNNDTDSVPLFSCSRIRNDLNAAPLVTSVLYDGPLVSYTGKYFGDDEKNLAVSLAGESCENPEICSKICRSCSDKNQCPVDSECLNVGQGGAHCFMFCAGTGDESCPCDTFCALVSISSYLGSPISVHLCTPTSFSISQGNVCDKYLNEKIQCSAPRASQLSALPYARNMSLAVGSAAVSGLRHTWIYPWCKEHSECQDGNICTQDSCVNGRCQYSSADGCSSTSSAVRNRNTLYDYSTLVSKDRFGQHKHLSDTMIYKGLISSVSREDDFPVQTLSLPFRFPFFGIKASTLAINPNGLLSLPPIQSCESYLGYAECIVYATYTNVISMWANDWDLSSGEFSTVLYLEQKVGDGLLLHGLDKDAFHVLFSNVYEYGGGVSDSGGVSGNDAKWQQPNSFSASLYPDGSIRLSYVQVTAAVAADNVAGLWASRASQDSRGSYGKYHSENVLSSIVQGTDVLFCPQFESVVCAVDACVHSGGMLTLHLQLSSCTALGAETDRNYTCEWAGGQASSPAVRRVGSGQSLLQCVVPDLSEILSDGTVVRVDIVSSIPLGVEEIRPVDSSSFFAAYRGMHGELATGHIMARYYRSGDDNGRAGESECGCSALRNQHGLMCDSCLVCVLLLSSHRCFHFSSAHTLIPNLAFSLIRSPLPGVWRESEHC